MRLSITRVGNSLGIVLPRALYRPRGWGRGTRLFIRPTERGLLLSETPRDPKLSAFMEGLRPLLGKEVLLVHLFGSYTRSDFREGRSDVDILVVIRGPDRVLRNRILDLAFDVDRRFGGSPLAPMVVPLPEFDPGWFAYEAADGYSLYRRGGLHLPGGAPVDPPPAGR